MLKHVILYFILFVTLVHVVLFQDNDILDILHQLNSFPMTLSILKVCNIRM